VPVSGSISLRCTGVGTMPVGKEERWATKPKAPQVGDLVKLNKNTRTKAQRFGVVVEKRGIDVRVYWFLSHAVLWFRRTSVKIMNRGVM